MKNSRILVAICLVLCIVMSLAACGQEHTSADCLDENKDHKCDVCSESMGRHADTNKDHVCDYGCSGAIGVCEDADLDHACDYGCSKTFGECADADKNHSCDYGCGAGIGECADADKDHSCDYGCGKAFGECADADLDHTCDYGCSKTFGEHTDADLDHACDYGCSEGIGECADADLDHACDYGCSVVIGEHADADLDHACDYGCAETIGECADADKNHSCDYGCGASFGEHADADLDHGCDYGCSEAMGDHADSADDGDHVCDYGCKAVLENCSDVLTDSDHSCDVCGKENITSHVYGEWTKNDADTHKQICNCGDVVTEGHKWDNGTQTIAPSCVAEGVMTYECEVCGETKTAAIVVLGHDIVNHEAKAPSCTEIGWDAYETCSRCDYTTKVEKEMLDHQYGWIIDRHPTIDETGLKHEECSACGAKRNENTTIDKLTCSHPEMVKIEAKAATCLEEGNKEYFFCSGCNKYYSNEEGTLETTVEENKIASLGHDMIIDEAVAPTCTATGLTEGSHCSRCDYKIAQETVPTIGHSYEAVVTDPTCMAQGYTTYTCSGCGDSYVGDYVDVATHSYEAVVTAPTCIAEGYTIYTCSVCGDSYVGDKVAATGKHADADGDKKCDGCDAVYYVVTLAGGATISASSDNSSAYSGAFLPGTELTVTADTYKTVEGKVYMLVGFDLNVVDNRIVDDGSSTVSYIVGEADATIIAKYMEANTTFFTTGTVKSETLGSTSVTVINDSTDPDLEGLSGWSFVIPNNVAATNSKTNNVTAVSMTAWGIDQEKVVRFVLKNTGDYDITVEICAEYFGYMVTTGYVTVPANSKVIAFMDFGPFSGAGTTCDFMIHVRENMTGDGSGTIQLDVVASAAKKYESKVSDFIVTSDKNVFMDFGESSESNTQANVSQASASGMNLRYWDQYGVMYFYGNNNTSADTYARERANALGDYAIHLQNGEKFTIYVKVTNLYHGGGGKYSLVFTRGSSSLSGSYLATQVLEFTEYGESYVYAIEIDPSKAGSSDNLQFGLKKAKADGTGGKVDVLIQIASENIFGEEPVNQ